MKKAILIILAWYFIYFPPGWRDYKPTQFGPFESKDQCQFFENWVLNVSEKQGKVNISRYLISSGCWEVK